MSLPNNQYGVWSSRTNTFVADKHFVQRSGSKQEMEILAAGLRGQHPRDTFIVKAVPGSLETK